MVRERMRIFGAGGGFVFTTIHNIQAACPGGQHCCFVRGSERVPLLSDRGVGGALFRSREVTRMGQLEELRAAIVDGQNAAAVAKVTEALASGLSPERILHEGLIAAMGETGALYQAGDIFVPEMLVAAQAMRAALAVLKPHLVKEGVASRAKVAIGTAQGDLHDIGKNLVAMFLEGNGFEVVDLGVDVAPERFVAEVNNGARAVAISALLTTTMLNMADVVNALVPRTCAIRSVFWSEALQSLRTLPVRSARTVTHATPRVQSICCANCWMYESGRSARRTSTRVADRKVSGILSSTRMTCAGPRW